MRGRSHNPGYGIVIEAKRVKTISALKPWFQNTEAVFNTYSLTEYVQILQLMMAGLNATCPRKSH